MQPCVCERLLTTHRQHLISGSTKTGKHGRSCPQPFYFDLRFSPFGSIMFLRVLDDRQGGDSCIHRGAIDDARLVRNL